MRENTTVANGYPPLCLHLCDQKQQLAMRAPVPDTWRIRSFLPTMASVICMCTAPCPVAGSWDEGGAATVLIPEIDKISCNLLSISSLEVTNFQQTLQSSNIVTADRFCQSVLSRQGDRFLVLLASCHLPRMVGRWCLLPSSQNLL